MQTARQISTLGLSILLLLGAFDPSVRAFGFPEGPEAEPSLTIYNQGFAVVRQKLPLDLKSGVNHMQIVDITAHLVPVCAHRADHPFDGSW